MVFSEIEPFGEAAADQRHGVATALLANCHRNPKIKPDGFVPDDFIPWKAANRAPNEPELLLDPEAQSRLIKQKLFKCG